MNASQVKRATLGPVKARCSIRRGGPNVNLRLDVPMDPSPPPSSIHHLCLVSANPAARIHLFHHLSSPPPWRHKSLGQQPPRQAVRSAPIRTTRSCDSVYLKQTAARSQHPVPHSLPTIYAATPFRDLLSYETSHCPSVLI
ncbi:predicted protein [Verticillium alfalfae VaMs.102]|uniref:Predicted protein n=1 Tax=Verticillium alfalfae (strain VaMs.102 / ATCC MYA-4576 / FGSC 10136) TaxID=526221 RepID=C9SXU7_VERA1|nr:predicted protein [Verticillium alfalfae VaMs.102]EEY23612.1 predicted protein [Verticillium alfalfae VaMs.102]